MLNRVDIDTEVKLSLVDLKRKRVIKFSNGFSGSNLDDLETGWNRIFLQSTEMAKDGKILKLVCKTVNGSVVSNHIHSTYNELLVNIKDVLDNMVGKSISNIYHIKIYSYE